VGAVQQGSGATTISLPTAFVGTNHDPAPPRGLKCKTALFQPVPKILRNTLSGSSLNLLKHLTKKTKNMTNMASLHSTLSNVLTSGKVLLPESEEYKSSNSTYFTAWANDTKPSHIVTPNSVQEVSELVKALNPLLGNGELQMAVRGGGHTPSGSGNIENGVTLNLQGLKGISLNEDKGVVTLGVGETWTSVYSELEKYGLTTAGGRVGRVGVPGFVLGGKVINIFVKVKLLTYAKVVFLSIQLVEDFPAIPWSTGKWFLHPAR